jgi:aldehyde:ferredoxin oxidoreductase
MEDGRLLFIDLTTASYRLEVIPPRVLADYLGGRGLAAYLLFKGVAPRVDPLDPANPLILTAGPAQGLSAPYSPKTVLGTKSPLTGIYLYSVASGSFGHYLARSGLAALVVTGRAASPTYIVIDGQRVEFHSATHLWGKKTGAAQEALLRETSRPKASVLTIGPAGERLVRLAAVVTEGDHARTFGRGGAGCVMGAKNLKGIVLARPPSSLPPADPQAFQEMWKWVNGKLKGAPLWVQERKQFGTGSDMVTLHKLGILPVRNWSSALFPQVERICPATNADEYPRRNVNCGPYCPTPCSHISEVADGPYRGSRSEGPEYETYYALGSNCGVDRVDAIVAAEELCDQYGLDTMSVGLAVSFAMECYERGLISSQDTDGVELRFGNHQAMVEMVRRIGEGQGLGQLLGQGTRLASQQIPGSQDFAIQVKGLELGGYDCRGLNGQALEFALSSRGGCHHALGLPARSEGPKGTGRQVQGKGQLLRQTAISRILYDCAILCTFPLAILGQEMLPRLLWATRGVKYSPEELERVGMRVLTLERLFNLREGLGREEDTLPGRLLREPLADGPNQGRVVDLEPLKDEAYSALGWDASGRPTEATLRELGLVELSR